MPGIINSFLSFGTGAPVSVYAGYNTVGGSTVQMTQYRVLAKKITLSVDALIVSIGAYLIATSDATSSLMVAVYEDNGGTPRYILATGGGCDAEISSGSGSDLLMEPSAGNAVARWLHRPVGLWCPAGDYWIAVQEPSTTRATITFDGSGTDRRYTTTGSWFEDWGFHTPTTETNRYSIRAETMT